jgi:hypothetical protein
MRTRGFARLRRHARRAILNGRSAVEPEIGGNARRVRRVAAMLRRLRANFARFRAQRIISVPAP